MSQDTITPRTLIGNVVEHHDIEKTIVKHGHRTAHRQSYIGDQHLDITTEILSQNPSQTLPSKTSSDVSHVIGHMKTKQIPASDMDTPRSMIEGFVQGHNTIQQSRRKRTFVERTPGSRRAARASPRTRSSLSRSLRKKATMRHFLQQGTKSGKETPRSMIQAKLATGVDETPVGAIQSNKDTTHKGEVDRPDVSSVSRQKKRRSSLREESFFAGTAVTKTRASLQQRSSQRDHNLQMAMSDFTMGVSQRVHCQDKEEQSEEPGWDMSDLVTPTVEQDMWKNSSDLTKEHFNKDGTEEADEIEAAVNFKKRGTEIVHKSMLGIQSVGESGIDRFHTPMVGPQSVVDGGANIIEERLEAEHPPEESSYRVERTLTEHNQKTNIIHTRNMNSRYMDDETQKRVMNTVEEQEEDGHLKGGNYEAEMDTYSEQVEDEHIQNTSGRNQSIQQLNSVTSRSVQLQQPLLPGYESMRTPVLPALHQTPKTTAKPPEVLQKARHDYDLLQKRGTHISQKKAPIKNKQKEKHSIPNIPFSVTKSIFRHFSKLKMAKDALPEIEKISAEFWKNAVSDVTAYTSHAHRSTVDEADIELLMRRQKFVMEKQSLHTLVAKYLPLEYQQEIIPVARSGNVVVPKT